MLHMQQTVMGVSDHDINPVRWLQFAIFVPMILGVAANLNLLHTMRSKASGLLPRSLRRLLQCQAILDASLCAVSSLYIVMPANYVASVGWPGGVNTALCYLWNTGFVYWLVAGSSSVLVATTTIDRVVAKAQQTSRIDAPAQQRSTALIAVLGVTMVAALAAVVTWGNNLRAMVNGICVLAVNMSTGLTAVLAAYVAFCNVLLPTVTLLGGVILARRLCDESSWFNGQAIVTTAAVLISAALFMVSHAPDNVASAAYAFGLIDNIARWQRVVWPAKYAVSLCACYRPLVYLVMMARITAADKKLTASSAKSQQLAIECSGRKVSILPNL